MKITLSDKDLVQTVKTAFYSVIPDYYAGWIFNEYDMVKSFYAAINPVLSKFQLPLISEVPLSHIGIKGNKKTVDLIIIRLKEDYNALKDFRYQAIKESVAALEFKYIKTKDTEAVKDDLEKLRLIRTIHPDILLFLIILHESKISEELASSFYNPETRTSPNNWKRYYELHFVPELSKPDFFVSWDNKDI